MHNYGMASSHGVIILLDYSQSQTNCIVVVRVCASTICSHKSIRLASGFCFSNFVHVTAENITANELSSLVFWEMG